MVARLSRPSIFAKVCVKRFVAALLLPALYIPYAARANVAELIKSSQPGWPQFRGPSRDGISAERDLLPTWPQGAPATAWSIDSLGRGYSSPIVVKDRIFITGDVGDRVKIFALDLRGKKVWESENGAAWTDDYPGSRASVSYHDGHVYHQNAHGRVACLDAANGREVWAVDLLQEFKGKNITWALSECLLVDDSAVYATAGGNDALMVALDRKSGSVVWKSEPLKDSEDGAVENASYVSPILVRFAGRKFIVGCSLRNLFCLDADNGKQQWTYRFPTSYSVLATMPVLVGDAIFMTAPHGKGGHLLRLKPAAKEGGPIGVEEVWSTRLDTCQGGVVYADGKLFGSYYGPRKGWAALDAKTGNVLYSAPDIIKGSAIHADERLYVLSEDGWMRLLEPADTQFVEKGKFRLTEPKRSDAWAHPVIHDGRLYLRYHDALTCYDIRDRVPKGQ